MNLVSKTGGGGRLSLFVGLSFVCLFVYSFVPLFGHGACVVSCCVVLCCAALWPRLRLQRRVRRAPRCRVRHSSAPVPVLVTCHGRVPPPSPGPNLTRVDTPPLPPAPPRSAAWRFFPSCATLDSRPNGLITHSKYSKPFPN